MSDKKIGKDTITDSNQYFFKNLTNVTHLAILGVGNEIKSDDAAGIVVSKEIKKLKLKNTSVFLGGTVPDSFIKPILKVKPSHVLIIDAAFIGLNPGEWTLLSANKIDEGIFSTHSIPLTDVAKLIEKETGAKIMFLCIQPKNLDVGIGLSNEVKEACKDIVREIIL